MHVNDLPRLRDQNQFRLLDRLSYFQLAVKVNRMILERKSCLGLFKIDTQLILSDD